MTIKRVKNAFHHHQLGTQPTDKKRRNIASAYFSAAMLALLFAAVILLLGIAVIGYEDDTFITERPVISIIIPPEPERQQQP